MYSEVVFLYTDYKDMKIVGHRGAAGLALENTLPAFQIAKSLGVDAVELDVRSTKDHKFVVCHDDRLDRVSTSSDHISKLSYAELQAIKLHNGCTVPLLRDILKFLGSTPVVIDVKTKDDLSALMDIIDASGSPDCTIVGWPNSIITECKVLRPNIPAFVGKFYTPFGIIRTIRKHNANGLNLKVIWLNPFIYHMLRRRRLPMQVYNVDSVWLAKILNKFYPDIWICTNYPDRLLKVLRKHQP